jgi:hypothetical protein
LFPVATDAEASFQSGGGPDGTGALDVAHPNKTIHSKDEAGFTRRI